MEQTSEILDREGDLIHCDRMRSHRLIMPAADPDARKTFAYRRPQPLGSRPGFRTVIEMRVIALDHGGIRERLSHAHLLCLMRRPLSAGSRRRDPTRAASKRCRPSFRI